MLDLQLGGKISRSGTIGSRSFIGDSGEGNICLFMVGSRKGESSVRKSARLEKKKRKIPVDESGGTDLGSQLHTDSESEEDLVVVHQEEETAASSPQAPDPQGQRERTPTPDREQGEEVIIGSDSEGAISDDMPTRLKYSKFRGDGRQDVDDWYSEFESIALANQEDEQIKQRIFQGLLKGEALKWYQDIPALTRNDWDNFVPIFLRTFREAGGEARALGRLSRITMKSSESVRKYGQRVKALIQKLTTDAAPALQVEWYVAGFPEKMGFQIRQSRPTTLREAMEAAQNYENSSQSLRKALKRSERKDVKQYRKDRSRKKYSDSDDSSSSTESDSGTSTSESSESDSDSKSRNRNRKQLQDRRGKGVVKVKIEKDDSKKVMQSIQETLEAIKVNLTENRKPRKIVPTSRANVWCPRCGNAGHFASECNMPPQRRIHYVNPEEEVYYTLPEEEEEEISAPVYQIHPTYGRGKAIQQPMRMTVATQPVLAGSSQGMIGPVRYQPRPQGYCFNCGSPDHYANVCPHGRPGQGAPLVLPCQNCQEYGHAAPQCPKPPQKRIVYKQVETPPRDQTALNYGHSAGIENPEK